MANGHETMEGNIAHTLIDGKHLIGCYAAHLQRTCTCRPSIVSLVRLVTYNRVTSKNRSQEYCALSWPI